MTKEALEQIVKALNDAQCRFLVVGGVAVVAHKQLQEAAKWPFARKIEWQEEAYRLAIAFQKALRAAHLNVPSTHSS